jgi:hypothetical protein
MLNLFIIVIIVGSTLLYRKFQSNGYSIALAISDQRISYHLVWLEKYYKEWLIIEIFLTLINVNVIILRSCFVREALTVTRSSVKLYLP